MIIAMSDSTWALVVFGTRVYMGVTGHGVGVFKARGHAVFLVRK